MLNEKIKNLRKQKGYTQEVLAQELNVVRQTVSKWEKGYSVPDAVMLERIAELFEVPVSELLTGKTEETEDSPSLMQISTQLSILNNQFARELARKRRNRRIAGTVILILLLIVGLIIFSSLRFQTAEMPEKPGSASYAVQLSEELDAALHKAILDVNGKNDWLGECPTEAHIVYGSKKDGDTVEVYLLENFSSYGFKDGYFTEVGGHAIPAVYTFRYKDSEIEYVSHRYAEDGGHYVSSIKDMFPHRIAKLALDGTFNEELEAGFSMQFSQAQKYLDKIGRTEKICNYNDIETVFLSDYGISVEVENSLEETRMGYDMTIGNHEVIEDGTRYVYQTDFDAARDLITFTKFEYGTNKIVEYMAIDGETGKRVENAEIPEKAEYRKGKLTARDTLPEYTTYAYYE